MKILYIANSRLPTEKAHGLQIMKTIEALLLEGVSVTLLVPRRKNPIAVSVQDFYSLKKGPKICYVPNYFWFLEKPFQGFYFSLQRITFGWSAFLAGLFSKAEAIYSREITVSFFLALFGKKVVYEDHEPKKSRRWLYKIFLKHLPCKVVVAKNLTDFYDSIGVAKNSYTIIPNGVDLEEFGQVAAQKNIWQHLDVSADKKVVLYVGHFYAWKGVYDLLAAADYLKDFQVVLIGGTSADHEKIQQSIKSKNSENVTIHPFMPHKEIIRYIKSADVLVLPNTAQEERSLRYTTPIKLFEYMASGVPIVATKIPSFEGYVQDGKNAFMCEPDNPPDLARAVNKVFSDPALAQMLAKKALEDVQAYSWKNRAKSIIDFIH